MQVETCVSPIIYADTPILSQAAVATILRAARMESFKIPLLPPSVQIDAVSQTFFLLLSLPYFYRFVSFIAKLALL